MSRLARVLPIVAASLALSCSDGPTAITLEALPGRWQMLVAANTGCDPEALARTINFTVEPVAIVGDEMQVGGLWDLGGPTVQGWGFSGVLDEAARSADLVFIHATGAAIRFVGRISDSRTMRGRLQPPPSGYAPLFDTGGCEQTATARREAD